jgi:energy-coupling factor transporter ATP-binding protein EcfA2
MANSGLDECHFRSTSSPCGHAIIGDPGRIHWRELPACCRAARPRSLNLDRRHAMSTAIAIEGVTKRFGSVLAVDRLDLKVPRGSLYGFIGPNGSGKSTTLRMIMHILLPDQGEVEVLGQRDTRAADDRVSYLPEERGLYRRMSVRRLLRYFGSLKGARQPELDQTIDKWLWGRRSCFRCSWPSGWTPSHGSSWSSTGAAHFSPPSSRRPRHTTPSYPMPVARMPGPGWSWSRRRPPFALAIRPWRLISPTASAGASSTPTSRSLPG